MKRVILDVPLKKKCVNVAPLEGNEIAPPLVLGKSYEVKEICTDSKGNEHYNVGLASAVNYVRSYETKEDLPEGDRIHWCHPSRFENNS